MKRIFFQFYFFALSFASLSAAEPDFSQCIDFSQFRSNLDNPDSEPFAWELGHPAFNFAPELTPYFAYLKQKYDIDIAIETGTYHGSSTVCFSYLFKKVHTIEIVEDIYEYAREKLKHRSNVECHLGSSQLVLEKILPELEGKSVLFYLDAHWGPYWPLLDEIEAISHTHRDDCIIVIDDFKVPGRGEIPFDHYDEVECSYEYIRTQLDKVFSDYDYHYIIPRSVKSRAKFIAIPKKWAREANPT